MTIAPMFAMLHPGGTDSRAMAGIAAAFADRFRMLTPDRRGHGRAPDVPGPMTFELMAEDTIELLERESAAASSGESSRPGPLLGYSDGAVVALLVALARPDLVSHLVLVSGVFDRTGWSTEMLDDEPPEFMADSYAEVSPDGREHWPIVVAKLREMHREGPNVTVEQLGTLRMPVLVVAGDDDDMPLEHTIALYRALPAGELAIVPHASHGVLVEKTALCAELVSEFLRPDKAPTFAPIRRSRD